MEGGRARVSDGAENAREMRGERFRAPAAEQERGAAGDAGGIGPPLPDEAWQQPAAPPVSGEEPWRPEVIALVGGTGTGKSYHASHVAHENDVELIIDDGLLIREGKILAGKSAKAEANRVGAIKRAIFADEDHSREAKEALHREAPQRILILATSLDMIGRITVALGLRPPARVIRIEDVASQRDIWRARRIRREQGKHVIPAPTLEVRKTFSGYLFDPLRFFLRPKGDRTAGLIVEKSVVRPTWSELGRFYIHDVVVMSIALRAAREVDGVARPLKARVQSGPEGTTIDLDIALWVGAMVVQVCQTAQLHVRKVLEYTTGLNVLGVNVNARTMVIGAAATAQADV